MIGWLLLAFFSGVVAVLVVELYVFVKWFKSRPSKEPVRAEYTPSSLREELANLCNSAPGTNPSPESCNFLNLIFAILYQEWKDSEALKGFFLKKMNAEIAELMLTKVVGRILQQVKICDFGFGPSIPIIKSATLMNVTRRSPEGSRAKDIETIDVALDIDYGGGFHVSFDADLVFGRRAFFFITVKKLAGKVRLQLSTKPEPHWSFSFYEEPQLDLEVETRSLGRSLPQFATLIKNQFKKSVKKKHTLPAHKIRHKPFFVQRKPQDATQQIYIHDSKIVAGKLTVEVHEARHLPHVRKQQQAHTYCTLEISDSPRRGPSFLSSRSHQSQIHEIEIAKDKSKSAGILFKPAWEVSKEERREIVVVDGITNGSAASYSGLQKGDTILAVGGIPSNTVDRTVKLIKHGKDSFCLTVQRSDASRRSFTSTVNESAAGVEDETDTGGGAAKPPRRGTADSSPKAKSLSEDYVMVAESQDMISQTSSVPAGSDVAWKEQFEFTIKNDAEFLNICVWNHFENLDGDQLIGHVSIPLMDVALQCMMISSGKHSQHFVLVPALPVSVNRAAAKKATVGLVTHEEFSAHARQRDDQVHAGVIFLHFQHTIASCVKTGKTVNEDERPDGKNKDEELVSTRHIHPLADTLKPEIQNLQHDFVRTSFSYSVQCNFCKKKVWRKEGFQCRACSMVSHRKCLSACQRESACPYRSRSASVGAKDEDMKPEEAPCDLSNITLLESSSHTLSARDEATSMAAEAAKQAGKELYSEIPVRERTDIFKAKLDELQEALDREALRKNELLRREKHCTDENIKVALLAQMAKLDDRTEALALLMMQFATGLAHCEEEEEKEKEKEEEEEEGLALNND